MTSGELRSVRKDIGLTQAGLAAALGLSRKHIVALEGGSAAVDRRTELAVAALAAQRGTVIEDRFDVGVSVSGTFYVSRRTVRKVPHPTAMLWTNSELVLYGEFDRALHAHRWRKALTRSDNPRNTRKLLRSRAAEQQRWPEIEAG